MLRVRTSAPLLVAISVLVTGCGGSKASSADGAPAGDAACTSSQCSPIGDSSMQPNDDMQSSALDMKSPASDMRPSGNDMRAGTTTYSTSFPTKENPISDSGHLITSTTPGVDWSGLELGGCGCKPVAPVAVTSAGLAQSPNVSDGGVGDALAIVKGTWGADQSATIVVANIAPSDDGYEEVEIHLRTDPKTGRGYEITWAYNHQYLIIATWNGGGVMGAGAAYTVLSSPSGAQYAIAAGDTLTASVIGNVITMSRNGTQMYQYTDTTKAFTSGNPGFGFNEGAAGSYGLSSFSASSM